MTYLAGTDPATPTRPDRPRRLARLAAALLLSVSATPAAATPATATISEPPRLAFDRHEVELDPAEHRTVLTGDLLGDASTEVALVSTDAAGASTVSVYGLEDGSWALVADVEVGSGIAFVDVARIAGRDRLLFYAAGRLAWFDLETGSEPLVAEVGVEIGGTDAGGVPRVDVTRDLNRDGRDDAVVPALDGFWIALQRSDGSFAAAVKLGPPEPFLDEKFEGRTYREVGITADTVPIYLSRVHELDYDRDGRSDLVFWNRDRFDAYLQTESGLFEPSPQTFTVEVPFDSDAPYSRLADFDEEGALSLLFGLNRKTSRTVLHSFRDLDGDTVADLVTLTLEGRSLLRQRSVYEVHFGTAADGATRFAREAGAAIRPRGSGGGVEPWGYAFRRFQDFDGDGRADLVSWDVRTGFGGMMRALVGNSVPIDLELFHNQGDGYPENATVRHRIRRFAPFAGLGNVFFPPILVGDLNGDGRSDLVVGHSPHELRLFFGAPAPALLAPEPQRVEAELPHDERRSRLVDLDADGREDLLFYLGPTGHDPKRPHRLTMLIAR